MSSAPKAKRELEQARKDGILPPEKDAATGELINPHIPEFMAKAPWYLNQSGPGLSHQRKEAEARKAFGFETYYRRGEVAGAAATAYRKGSCRNCGAATHTERECTERPRRVGAWKSGSDIKPDEILPGSVALDWDSKRDRYAGYDPEAHAATIARYAAAEEERKLIREQARLREAEERRAAKDAKRAARRAARRASAAAAPASVAAQGSSSSSSGSGADAVSGAASSDAKAAATAAAATAAAATASVPSTTQGRDGHAPRLDDDAATASDAGSRTGGSDSDTGSDTDYSGDDDDADEGDVRESDARAALLAEVSSAGKKMSVRNLRLREDTAKYLHNLDVDSAYYDPKTRSMRENPRPDMGAEAPFAGDAAWRASGAVSEIAAAQVRGRPPAPALVTPAGTRTRAPSTPTRTIHSAMRPHTHTRGAGVRMGGR